MENPYAPPSAELAEPAAPARRPVLVWIISLWYGFGAVSSPFVTFLLMSGAMPLPAAERERLAALGSVLWIQIVISSALTLWFAVELFRLRSRAVSLAAWLIAMSAASQVITFSMGGLPAAEARNGVFIGVAVGVTIALAIYLYARRLRARGVLR